MSERERDSEKEALMTRVLMNMRAYVYIPFMCITHIQSQLK